MSDINTLREHLFTTLQGLQDKDKPMEIERAKAICDVGQVIINSAKAEIDFLRANGSVETKFFTRPALPAPGAGRAPLPPGADDIDDDAPAPSSRETETGTVTIDHRNGYRVVRHKQR